MTMTKLFKKVEGQILSYSAICKELGFEVKDGNSKKSQIKEWQLYCNIEKIPNSTKYYIKKVYDTKQLGGVNPNNKFQIYIEGDIIKLLIENQLSPIYISQTQLLEKLNLVNKNFRFLKRQDNFKKLLHLRYQKPESVPFLPESCYLNIIGKILSQWVDRCINRMCTRDLLKTRPGYCLIESKTIESTVIYSKVDVPFDSDLEKKIDQCYKETYLAIFPNGNKESGWIPPLYDDAFHFTLMKKVTEAIGKQCVHVYRVTVLMVGEKTETVKKCCAPQILNKEAVRKIEKTTQLDELTGSERKKIIESVIKYPAPFLYENILEEN